jgi:hypothetical protein
MFCRLLLETHNPYKPTVINWPKLSPEVLQRVTGLPIWDIAVQTEGRASIRVATYAGTVTDDPLLRAALDMGASEEARHRIVLSKLVEAYGIPLAPEPSYPAPKDPEWAWLVTGYSECIDSFFAFGLFDTVLRQLGRLVSAQPTAVETALVYRPDSGGVGISSVGANRYCPWPG